MLFSFPISHWESQPSLVAVANNTNLPFTYNTDSNWVHNSWTTHRSGPVTYSGIQVVFVNGINGQNSETNAFYDFTLRCAIFLNGVFYQGLCNGNIDATVAQTWGTATFVFPTLTSIPANTTFYITNRRVATDLGVAGSYNVITNTGGITQRQDGCAASTSTANDFTLGVGLAYGAKNNRVTAGQISGGVVTGVTKSAGGQGYTSGMVLGPWYGPAGAGAKGATIPGSGITGYGNFSGGQYTTTSITSGGTGHSTSNPPYIFLGGVNNAASGFGVITASYGPSIIMGVPASKTPSVLLHGDSIVSGYGSVDTTGDLNANYGIYEQTLANTYGLFKIAVPGESAAGWVVNNTKQIAFINSLVAKGFKITHVIIGLGVNDFIGNTNSNVVSVTQANITSIANIWRGYGAKVIMTTIPPYNTSTDAFVTTTNQTVGNSNYTLAGFVDTYNTAIKAGTPTNDGTVDIRGTCQSSATTTAWRTDTYGGGSAFCYTDGIHPSIGVGIPYGVLNLSIPALTV